MIRLFFLLPVLAVALFAGSSGSALAQSTVISFSPSTTYVAPGSGPFTVDVWVEDVVTRDPCPWPPGTGPCGLGAYGLKISFDETILDFQQFENGPFLGSTGRTLLFCPDEGLDHDPANGVIHYTCNSSGSGGGVTPFGPTGSGVLATITFDPLTEGTSSLVFELTTLAEIDSFPIPHSSENGSVVIAPLADLEVSKTAPGTVIAPGSVSYTLEVTNLGPNTALNATAVDTLPNDVIFDSASTGCAYDGPSHTVTCDLGDMNDSQTESPTIDVTVPASAAGESLLNAVDVSSDTVDPVTSNNHDEASTTVNASDVLITKTVPDWVDQGASGQYEIDLFSTGPSHAASVSVTDPLPPDVVYVGSSVTPSGSCSYSAGPHEVTCTGLGDMGPADTATVTIDVTFPNADILKCNEATVNWTATPPGDKQSGEECTIVGYEDTDGDGCPDVIEEGSDPTQGGGRDPLNPYDFYDITNITGVVANKDRGVTGFDLSLLLAWGNAISGGGPNPNGLDYDVDGNPPTDGIQPNTIADGLELDFASISGPATGPDGGITGFDLSQLVSEGNDICVIPQ